MEGHGVEDGEGTGRHRLMVSYLSGKLAVCIFARALHCGPCFSCKVALICITVFLYALGKVHFGPIKRPRARRKKWTISQTQ